MAFRAHMWPRCQTRGDGFLFHGNVGWLYVGFAFDVFIGRSSVTLRRGDKETRVRNIRLGWNGLAVLLGAVAHMHSEHAR